MAVISALQRALGTVRRNPVLVLVALTYSLLQLPSLLVQQLDPMLATGVSLLFSGHAIVLDDAGAVGGLKRSVATVRANLPAVLGHSAVIGLVSGGLGIAGALYSVLFSPQFQRLRATEPGMLSTLSSVLDSPLVAIGVAVVIMAVSGVVGSVLATYSTAFYRQVRPATGPAGT